MTTPTTAHPVDSDDASTAPERRRAVVLNDVADALLPYRRNDEGPYASQHEGWAFILEHSDDVWHQVRFGTTATARAAALHLACAALRFMSDFDTELMPGRYSADAFAPPRAYRVASALGAADAELRDATGKFGPFASAREGYAVILEEVDEMRVEVMHGPPVRAREEATQVAAMAMRFLVDIVDQAQS